VPADVPKARKIELLMIANDAARGTDSSIVQVSAGYSDSTRRILVANSDGILATDEQVRTLFRLSAVANGDTGLQTGYDSLGHTIGFELFDEESVAELAGRAARQAVTKLKARPAPSGATPVVIKRGSGGVLFHEACGHGLEADLVARGASVYANRVGELVASPCGVPSASTTRATSASATCSSRTACSPTTCGTTSVRATRAGRRAATAAARATSICPWSG
jgi:TldD protein